MNVIPSAPVIIRTADAACHIVLGLLTIGCLRSACAALKLHRKPQINGAYEIEGDTKDLQVILSNPKAAELLKSGYPYGIPACGHIEILGVRFPEGIRPIEVEAV